MFFMGASSSDQLQLGPSATEAGNCSVECDSESGHFIRPFFGRWGGFVGGGGGGEEGGEGED